jgi:putative OPT family oligopeptide transporter
MAEQDGKNASTPPPGGCEPEFKPYIPHDKTVAELTVRAVVIGVVLAIVFGAANAYLGLKIGMTISASIPAAVISMAVLRAFFKNGTVLENNIAQTIGSSGESLAAGVIFTIPAFFLLAAGKPLDSAEAQSVPGIGRIVLLSLMGGFLGILFMIPLRRYLMVREHGKLPFPEGTACAEVLIAGEKGGSQAKLVGAGLLVGGAYQFLMKGLCLWKEEMVWSFKKFHNAAIGIDATPCLLGVGYIIGPRISAVMLAGGMLGWVVLVPLISFFGSGSPNPILPAADVIGSLDAGGIWKNYIRYIGAGAVALGGMVSLVKCLPVIFSSFGLVVKELSRGRKAQIETKRTDRDLPMSLVVFGAILVVIVMFGALEFWMHKPGLNLAASAIIVIFGFFFVTVAARIVGIVGSSSCPVSGMTLATLLFATVILVWLGWTGTAGIVAALTVGTVVCIAICMSSDASQDLKTGFLLGGTPWKQQTAEFIGVLAPAVFVGLALLPLRDSIVSGDLKAPQANLVKMVVTGVMENSLPWTLVGLGALIAVVVELLGISSLPFAIGLYLPVSLSTPIIVGGLIYWIVSKLGGKDECKEREQRGILFSSGLVAGDALVGIVVAVLSAVAIGKVVEGGQEKAVTIADKINLGALSEHFAPGRGEWVGDLISLSVFAAMAVGLLLVCRGVSRRIRT